MIYLCLGVTLVVIFKIILRFKKGLHMLQLEHYHNQRYIQWMGRNLIEVFSIIDLLSIFMIIVSNVNITFNIIIVSFVGLLNIFSILTFKKAEDVKSLVRTSRINRLIITLMILNFIITSLYVIFLWSYKEFYGLLILTLLLSLASYIQIILVNLINMPIEKAIQIKFIRRAKIKINHISPKTIGITGSYGKTSTKFFIAQILSHKYTTLFTPSSYNTTMGVTRTINENMNSYHETFVCEMGAYYIGDIKEICDIVKPKYGVLTSIGNQHLNTFKTIDNIIKTKFELIESLDKDGIAILNYDNEYIRNKDKDSKCKIYTVGLNYNDVDYYARNIKYSVEGTSFDVEYHGKSESMFMYVHGEHNVSNMLCAIALAHQMGLDFNTIRKAVKRIRSVKHRLEVKRSGNLILIDDAFNANPIGAYNALKLLDSFKEEKIIITPGMIDLGSEQHEVNYNFGRQISEVCDKVYLVGEKQTQSIYQGLIDKGYSDRNIYVFSSFKKAFSNIDVLKKQVVLIENDLPDNH